MPMQPPVTPPAGLKPTRARHLVIVFAVTLAVVTYIDRVCISQAAPLIRRDLNLSPVQMGYAFAAFAWAYALFEVPGGWLGDWMGPRRVLMRIVLWWSIFTAATGWAWNQASLVVTRFMFGAGEAGCFPNLTKSFTTWLPQDERVRAQGIMWLSARWGGAFTPLLVVWVLQHMSWRRAFEVFGGLGVVWALFFFRWYRDNPRDHKSVNAAELALLRGAEETASGHGDVPWRKFLTSRTVWMLWWQYFALSWGWYFYITWLPTYLREARGVELGASAVLAGLPLFLGGTGCLVCGQFLPHLSRWMGDPARARRLMACIGFTGASALLVLSSRMGDPVLAMVAMGFSSFCNDLVMPPAWGACMDVGGKYAGTLSGSMNMFGNFAGGLAPIAIGYVLKFTNQDWNLTLLISAAVYFAGTFCWLFLDPVTPLEKQKP
ncbi:MAG: MFS transporter [Acidobacteria bacterium]|nr:MFS transporter [Acidobacteriota bacterium]